MKIFILLALLFASFTSLAAPDYTPPWTPNKIVVFGDGHSDNGNAYRFYKFPVSPPYWHGRFSNGPVWVEQLAYQYGLIADPSKNPNYPRKKKLQDYAVGHSTILFRDRPKDGKTKTLDQQVVVYTRTKPKDNANTLAIIWDGTNDMKAPKCINKPFRCVDSIINNMNLNMGRLYKTGIRHFIVVSIPDISQTPLLQKTLKPTRLKQIHDLVRYLNHNLYFSTYRFVETHKGAKSMLVDIEAFKLQDKTADDRQWHTPCYNNHGNVRKVLKALCDDPTDTSYYYWDSYFTTADVQQTLANVVISMTQNLKWWTANSYKNTQQLASQQYASN